MQQRPTQPADDAPTHDAAHWLQCCVTQDMHRGSLLRRRAASHAVVTVADSQQPLFGLQLWPVGPERRQIILHGDASLARWLPPARWCCRR